MLTKNAITFLTSLLLCGAIVISAVSASSADETKATDDTTTVTTAETSAEVSETAHETVADTTPETVADTIPETAADTIPEAEPETAPAVTQAESSAPIPSPADPTKFDSSLFIGDSRTEGLFEYASLGSCTVFAANGMNVFRVFKEALSVPGIGTATLDDLLAARTYNKIYIMLGMNEIGYDHSYVAGKYAEVVSRVRASQPDAVIYLEANLAVTKARSDIDEYYNNAGVRDLNTRIQALCDGVGTVYLDVNPLFDDGAGNLDAVYTTDDFHLKAQWYQRWGEWLCEVS